MCETRQAGPEAVTAVWSCCSQRSLQVQAALLSQLRKKALLDAQQAQGALSAPQHPLVTPQGSCAQAAGPPASQEAASHQAARHLPVTATVLLAEHDDLRGEEQYCSERTCHAHQARPGDAGYPPGDAGSAHTYVMYKPVGAAGPHGKLRQEAVGILAPCRRHGPQHSAHQLSRTLKECLQPHANICSKALNVSDTSQLAPPGNARAR